MSFKSGVVALVGRPNVGKSTLVNTVVGQKISIVSDKPQTTRRRALGIATTADWQIAFVDTPGIHAAHHKLGKALNQVAKQSVAGVDVLLVMVDGSKPPTREDEAVAQFLKESGFLDDEVKSRTILCLNKMDLLKASHVEENYEKFVRLFPANEVMMTSLSKRQNIDLLVGLLVKYLPEGPPHFDPESVTDQPMRVIAAEFVREKALNKTRQEVPHALATYVEDWVEEDKIVNVSVVLLVEREGQKAILIGKKGALLKEIGQEARVEIEELVGKKVFLELFVKVRSEWRQNPRILHELDYL